MAKLIVELDAEDFQCVKCGSFIPLIGDPICDNVHCTAKYRKTLMVFLETV